MQTSSRPFAVESLEARYLLAGNCFQNPIDANDVNNDGIASIADTRQVFTQLLADDAPAAEGEHVQMFLDVNGDGAFGVGDLRSIFSNTWQAADDIDLDSIAQHVVNIAHNSEAVANLIEHWQSGPGETITHIVDDLLSEQSERIESLRDSLDYYFSHYEAKLAEVRESLDAAVAIGLENAAEALADVHVKLSEIRSEVYQHTEYVLQHHLNSDRLRAHMDQLLTQVGLDGLRQDVSSFIDEVEAGDIQLTPEAQDLVAILQSSDLEISLQTLYELDVEPVRTGIVDLLDAYEQSGRDLPSEAAELRDALNNGETLVSYIFGLPWELGGSLGQYL